MGAHFACLPRLEDLKRDGRVQGIGVGSKDWTVIRDLYDRQPLDWVMTANSLTIHSHPKELLQFIERLRADDVGVMNSAVFNAGFLVGGEFYNYRRILPETDEGERLSAWRSAFHATCQEFAVNPALACVVFGISPPGVLAVALSSTRPDRVRQNVAAVQATLPGEFWLALKERGLMDADYPYLPDMNAKRHA